MLYNLCTFQLQLVGFCDPCHPIQVAGNWSIWFGAQSHAYGVLLITLGWPNGSRLFPLADITRLYRTHIPRRYQK